MKRTDLAPICAPAFLALAQGVAAQSTLDRADAALLRARDEARPALPDRAEEATAPARLGNVVGRQASEVRVDAIVVVGLAKLTPAVIDDATAPFTGRALSADDLKALANAVAARARALGYPLATSRIPPQSVSDGVLRLEVDEGRIDEVRLQGAQQHSVIAQLDQIGGGDSVRRDRLERDLLLAGDLPGVELGDARLRHEHGRSVLLVDATSDPVDATFTMANDGVPSRGPWRATAQVDFNQLLGPDRLTLFALTVPDAPSELSVGYGRYARRVSASGLDLGIEGSLSRARPSGLLQIVDTRGNAWRAAIDASYPLVRGRKTSLWGTISGEVEDSRQRQLDFLVRHDRLAVVRVGLNGFTQIVGGRVRASVTLNQGVDAGHATERGDPRASRELALPEFTKINLAASGTWRLAGPVSVAAAIETQAASGTLLIGEQFGLGGSRLLRGYDFSERTGDDGTAASIEARVKLTDKPARVSLYAFTDAGRVQDKREAGGQAATLFSGGAGIRAKAFGFELDSFLAFPLNGPRYESGSRRARLQFLISREF